MSALGYTLITPETEQESPMADCKHKRPVPRRTGDKHIKGWNVLTHRWKK